MPVEKLAAQIHFFFLTSSKVEVLEANGTTQVFGAKKFKT